MFLILVWNKILNWIFSTKCWMNNLLNEYFRFNFELNIELNQFLTRFNVKINNQNVSSTPTWGEISENSPFSGFRMRWKLKEQPPSNVDHLISWISWTWVKILKIGQNFENGLIFWKLANSLRIGQNIENWSKFWKIG